MPDLVFGRHPANLGGQGEYLLLEKACAVASSRAFTCRTWGQFAEIAGLRWNELYEEWAEDYAEARWLRRSLKPTSRFRYADIFFGRANGPQLPHPARVAYEIVHSCPYIRDYLVARELEFEPGSPAGRLECVRARSRNTFVKLQEYLSREKRHRWTLEEDNRLVRRALRGGR